MKGREQKESRMVGSGRRRGSHRVAVFASLAIAASGCDFSGTAPAAGATITLSTDTVTIAQGTTGSVIVTLDGLDGFADQVDLVVEGLPAGVTAGTLSLAAGQTTGALTLTVAYGVSTGTSELTVHAHSSTPGGGAATALSAAGHSAPQMKMNANGQGVLTFSDSIGRVHARLLTPTGWAAAQYVANAHIVAPAVALHADGRIAIASLSVGTGQNTLYHWSYDPGNQAWSSASVVRATTGASIGAPSVRFDAAGNEVVLWSETQTGNGPVQVNARRFITGGMGWLAQAAVSPLVTGEAHTNPALAVAADGTSMALWYHVSNQGQSRVPVYALLR